MPELDTEKLSLIQWAVAAGAMLGGTLLGLFGFGKRKRRGEEDEDSDDHIELYFLRALRKIEEGQREERRLLYERIEKMGEELDKRLRAVELAVQLLEPRVDALELLRPRR